MATDQSVVKHIKDLADEEHHLYEKGDLTDAERERLKLINIALDQYWDLCASAGRNANSGRILTRRRSAGRESSRSTRVNRRRISCAVVRRLEKALFWAISNGRLDGADLAPSRPSQSIRPRNPCPLSKTTFPIA